MSQQQWWYFKITRYYHQILIDREEDGLFGDDEEEEAQLGVPKQFYYDEYDDPYDILKMMMNYVDNDAGTCLHLATKVSLQENPKLSNALLIFLEVYEFFLGLNFFIPVKLSVLLSCIHKHIVKDGF